MNILPHLKNYRYPLSVFLACIVASVFFFSCEKKNSEKAVTAAQAPAAPARLLTVANVLDKEENIEVWFYETPLIHHISRSNAEVLAYKRMLTEAMNRQEPVAVAVTVGSQNRIHTVKAATAEELETYRSRKTQEEKAIEVQAPEATDAARLTANIPNTTTLNTIFTTLSNQCCKVAGPYLYGQCIPFQYVADGCYARAHKMRQVIEGTYGYSSYKVFHYLDRCNANPGSLAVKATLWGNNCCVKWWYHVAPYVFVTSGASSVAYVMDPSMFTGPVSIATWQNAQKNASCGSGTVISKLAYYTSTAYAPSSFNFTNCTINVFADAGYTSANSTCASYAPLQGCF
jgi:Glutaminase